MLQEIETFFDISLFPWKPINLFFQNLGDPIFRHEMYTASPVFMADTLNCGFHGYYSYSYLNMQISLFAYS